MTRISPVPPTHPSYFPGRKSSSGNWGNRQSDGVQDDANSRAIGVLGVAEDTNTTPFGIPSAIVVSQNPQPYPHLPNNTY